MIRMGTFLLSICLSGLGSSWLDGRSFGAGHRWTVAIVGWEHRVLGGILVCMVYVIFWGHMNERCRIWKLKMEKITVALEILGRFPWGPWVFFQISRRFHRSCDAHGFHEVKECSAFAKNVCHMLSASVGDPGDGICRQSIPFGRELCCTYRNPFLFYFLSVQTHCDIRTYLEHIT